MPEPSFATVVSKDDEVAICEIMERLKDAWNCHDMNAYVADMAPDVDWVNVVGMHWRGREPVRLAHAALHKTMFANSRLLPGTMIMRQIAANVILLVSTGGIEGVGNTPDGAPYPATGSRMTVVLVKMSEGWNIVHAHNTNIDARAQQHDPMGGA